MVFERFTRVKVQVHNILFCLLDAPTLKLILFGYKVVQTATKWPRIRVNSKRWLVRNELWRWVADMAGEVWFLG